MKKLILSLALLAVPFFAFAGWSGVYRNGDVNLDGQICMDDPVFIIYHLYRDGRPLPCPDVADADRDGSVSITDAVVLLKYIFNGEYLFDCPISCGADDSSEYEFGGYVE
tara:strand:+ start:142 stop:471 length:330 start_codon:yes stop_codon:yes gene_type:complete